MSLRGIWVVANDDVLIVRRFSTVERRARQSDRAVAYSPLPVSDEQWCKLVLAEIAASGGKWLSPFPKDYVVENGCRREDTCPVYAVNCEDKALCNDKTTEDESSVNNGVNVSHSVWPVVVYERNYFTFICVPLVDISMDMKKNGNHENAMPMVIETPDITMGLLVLRDIANALFSVAAFQPLIRIPNEDTNRVVDAAVLNANQEVALAELNNWISVALPLGSPVDMDRVNVAAMLQGDGRVPVAIPDNSKQPSWKPLAFKGRQSILFNIVETIYAVQHHSCDMLDLWHVVGSVQVTAALSGVPDVIVTLSSAENIDNLVLYQNVTSSDVGVKIASTRKLTFSPSMESFDLCHYRINGVKELPIRGTYQLKESRSSSVEILIKLRLLDKVPNNFDYCDVSIPFYNRGPIASLNGAPTIGSVSVGSYCRSLVWTIGEKFGGRHREVAFHGIVSFKSFADCDEHCRNNDINCEPLFIEDPFCVGLNAFIDLRFSFVDHSMSQCRIDPQAILLYPSTFGSRPRISTKYSTVAGEYRIWNMLGNTKAFAGSRPVCVNEATSY